MVRGGLAVLEAFVERRAQHFLCMGCRHFDEVAQHIVVLDLERRNLCVSSIFRLHLGDHAAPLVAQGAAGVELFVIARSHKPAVAGKQRRLRHKRRIKQIHECIMPQKLLACFSQKRGQLKPGHIRAYITCFPKTVANTRQVSRPAALKPKP